MGLSVSIELYKGKKIIHEEHWDSDGYAIFLWMIEYYPLLKRNRNYQKKEIKRQVLEIILNELSEIGKLDRDFRIEQSSIRINRFLKKMDDPSIKRSKIKIIYVGSL